MNDCESRERSAIRRTPLSVEWIGGVDGCARLLDQTLLPTRLQYIDCRDAESVYEAIRALRVRGAPAIGIAAAMGLVLGVRQSLNRPRSEFFDRVRAVSCFLRGSRPTAVNLFWALDRMERVAQQSTLSPGEIVLQLLDEAKLIRNEDREMCAAIGRHGCALLESGTGVLTHCNAGGLATAEYGTALAVLYQAHDAGKRIVAYVDETRPLLQGSRLTAWELQQHGVPTVLLCDNMAGVVMRQGKVQAVVVGADRIAANGDCANKIGTYSVAVLAKAHQIPFYVAAPSSTFDFSVDSGDLIPIEMRDPIEVTNGFGRQTAPEGIEVYNPAFDVTPAELVTAFITQAGVVQPPFRTNLASILQARS